MSTIAGFTSVKSVAGPDVHIVQVVSVSAASSIQGRRAPALPSVGHPVEGHARGVLAALLGTELQGALAPCVALHALRFFKGDVASEAAGRAPDAEYRFVTFWKQEASAEKKREGGRGGWRARVGRVRM